MNRGPQLGGVNRPAAGERLQIGDVPPSTLAAQLVQRFTNGTKRPKVQDPEAFKQLLSEVLSTDADPSGPTDAVEDDVDINTKLIYVIVKAGLESLPSHSPFENVSKSSQQVLDSLAALEITLRRCPEVLFVTSPNQETQPYGSGLLYQWLLPRLFAFLARSAMLEEHRGAVKLLKSCIRKERKLQLTPVKYQPILAYIKGCTQDLIRCLEASDTAQLKHSNVPSAETLQEQDENTSKPILSSQAATMAITGHLQALNVATCLLSIVVDTDSDNEGVLSSPPFHSNCCVWILGITTRLWEVSKTIDSLFDNEQASFACLHVVTKILRSYVIKCLHAKSFVVILSRSSLLLSQILASVLSNSSLPLEELLEEEICLSLVDFAYAARVSDVSDRILNEILLTTIQQISNDRTRFDALTFDLQRSINLFVAAVEKDNASAAERFTNDQITNFKSSRLMQAVRKHLSDGGCEQIQDGARRPVKRVRIWEKDVSNVAPGENPNLMTRIACLLGVDTEIDLSNLSRNIVDRYPKLSERDQSQVFSSLGQLACQFAVTPLPDSHDGKTTVASITSFIKCTFCDLDNRRKTSFVVCAANQQHRPITQIFLDLISLPKDQKSRQPRVAAMMALGRVLSHTNEEQHLSLATSTFGQWCLQALQSSMRELRIAAGRTLPVFLRDSLELSVYAQNRRVALDLLRSISDRGDIGLQETCILAWSQIAQNLNDGGEMNLVLHKLVEYLGHTNALICGLAFDELQRLCNHSPFSARKVFAPYWRIIAVTVVDNLQRRPQIAQQMSDLLAMSVSEFLVLTQVHTTPFFVLTKKQETLRRIADACGRSLMALCRDHANLAAILASILLQSSNDAESLIMGLLNAVSPEFAHVDCAELLKSEPQATAAELLKSAGDDDELKRTRAHHGLQVLANVTQSKQGPSRGAISKVDNLAPFFENHVLGIMAILADTINDGKGPQPRLEKVICLGAIREMIGVARGHVSNGLPQICACLRSAIGSRDLANEAFQAWIVMMETLQEDDIANLIDPTFAIVAQYWEYFSLETQRQAYEMVSHLLKSHQSMIRDLSGTLPSLAEIPLMSKFDDDIQKAKLQMDVKQQFQNFAQRLRNENTTVVTRALSELATFLEENQDWLHETAISELPDPVVNHLTRSLLDTSVTFNESHTDISILCARCLGYIGCLDPTTVEAVRDKKQILVLSNFTKDEEIRDFIIFFLHEVLVKAFLSVTNSRSQGFLAYAMQELLSLGDFQFSVGPRSRNVPFDANSQRWNSLPESIRTVLTPFLDSKYFVTAGVAQSPPRYPLFSQEISHRQWLRNFSHDLLRREGGDSMTQQLFSILSRIIRSQDIAIPEFLLPFAALNTVLNGGEAGKGDIAKEMLAVLNQPLTDNAVHRENIILCSQSIFHVLDYLTRWMQEKKKELSRIRSPSSRGRHPTDFDIERDTIQISVLEEVLNLIPADVISRRAVECKSFSRALFHWEQYMRQEAQKHVDTNQFWNQEPRFERLQDIYTQIDEPDGIEGISAHLQVLNIDQQILEHRKAGRWSAAQSWYEILLSEQPTNLEVQSNLLTSLKESGQYDNLLSHVQGFEQTEATKAISLPFAAEASWITGRWDKLKSYIEQYSTIYGDDFNIGIGRALEALIKQERSNFSQILNDLRQATVRGLSATNTSSLQTCRDRMLRFHVLTELDAISNMQSSGDPDKSRLMTTLDRRLGIIGPFPADKQYILGVRRAAMQLCKTQYTKADVSSVWLTSAKLARKGGFTHQAFDAVLHASRLQDASATIEHSRLLWRAGNHRKAIQSLNGAIAANAFQSHDHLMTDDSHATGNHAGTGNVLKAKAYLLLAKWIDQAGQTQSSDIVHQYQQVTGAHSRWEKGHYYLGKHYNKLLESQKAQPLPKQAQTFITGETAKLVVENYLRSLAFGAKYIYQTLPRILTLWLGLGYDAEKELDIRYGNDAAFRAHILSQRRKLLSACNSQVKKYIDRLPAWVFYTALPQIVARICLPNQAVYSVLLDIVSKVVIHHTPQALWTLLAMVKSSSKDRANRGLACVTKVLENAKKEKKVAGMEMKSWITQGQKLSEQLLQVCEGDIQGKANHISLSKDLGFNHKAVLCKLAVPFESELTATLPAANVNVRQHKAFSNSDYVYISSFLDDVLVLNSLQKPRKISIRGSDGRVYAILCKPKDDLRKDQRLMEFNAMINRSLKKDAESSKRRLYIKTYAVTPLNEECGLIEWVDNLKTLRDILLASYKQKAVVINYGDIRQLLNEAVSTPRKIPIFTNKIIPTFPPVFHEWFVEMFPEPDAWFTARLRYTRSCAVMSIVGHVLGLGDRHGENILFEEGTGGTLHVDFNCLFDKGLTFEKPELVPFRLTHNMVDAFGAQGYEGPFRKSCELTLGILRGNEDTLMTILETFLYDPTTDFIGKKKKVNPLVPTTPEGVLESVRNKVRGLLAGESVPLSIEGYTDEQIKRATDPWNLASMYIGWCAFF